MALPTSATKWLYSPESATEKKNLRAYVIHQLNWILQFTIKLSVCNQISASSHKGKASAIYKSQGSISMKKWQFQCKYVTYTMTNDLESRACYLWSIHVTPAPDKPSPPMEMALLSVWRHSIVSSAPEPLLQRSRTETSWPAWRWYIRLPFIDRLWHMGCLNLSFFFPPYEVSKHPAGGQAP